ncbi:Uncharacterised protein [Mycobacteroides abscessus subsp. abscessus]|nr:Uncharacterised protein [Mycobacteroides abscessus subsp. abscessus]
MPCICRPITRERQKSSPRLISPSSTAARMWWISTPTIQRCW